MNLLSRRKTRKKLKSKLRRKHRKKKSVRKTSLGIVSKILQISLIALSEFNLINLPPFPLT